MTIVSMSVEKERLEDFGELLRTKTLRYRSVAIREARQSFVDGG